jgi:hypothetical protein
MGGNTIHQSTEEEVTTPFDRQVGGDHYKNLGIQPIDYILSNGLGFAEGNIIKYTTRYRQKGGVEDLRKVIHYAELLIAHLEREKAKCSTSES